MSTDPNVDADLALVLLRRAIAASTVNATYLLSLPDVTKPERELVHRLIAERNEP